MRRILVLIDKFSPAAKIEAQGLINDIKNLRFACVKRLLMAEAGFLKIARQALIKAALCKNTRQIHLNTAPNPYVKLGFGVIVLLRCQGAHISKLRQKLSGNT